MSKLTNVGDEYETNSFGKCRVVEYISASNVLVQFDNTGNTEKVAAGNLRNGYAKDRMARCVEGVGYMGRGGFISRTKTGGITKEYNAWSAMLRRCYGKTSTANARVYENCEVSEGWQNFQEFAKWCQTQPEFLHSGCALDKDILVKGNKIYGPEACTFVPVHVNSAVTLEKHTNTTGYPGVWVNASGGFTAEITMNSTSQSLGTFKRAVDAFTVYKAVKEAYVNSLAEVYKGVISCEAYNSLSSWSIE